MKIYTRTGDDGTTGLFGAGRVAKDHARIEAIGTVDETNAAIGVAYASATTQPVVRSLLSILQHDLFVAGADLATPLSARAKTQRITKQHIEKLERTIDTLGEPLPPLKHFVLPGGTDLAARLHLARVISRRAERCVVSLGRHEELNQLVVVYLNRLSDLLFVLARHANFDEDAPDILWMPLNAD